MISGEVVNDLPIEISVYGTLFDVIKIDDHHIACTGNDHTISIWELNNKKKKYALKGHENALTKSIYHPGMNVLCSSSTDKHIRIWDGNKDWECTSTFALPSSVTPMGVSIANEYNLVISGSCSNSAFYWDMVKQKFVNSFTVPVKGNSNVWIIDTDYFEGDHLSVIAEDQSIHFIDVRTFKVAFTI